MGDIKTCLTAVRFGTDGWRAIIGKDFTTGNVKRVAKATADWVLKQSRVTAQAEAFGVVEPMEAKKIVIGYDCRFGGALFSQAAINVFCNAGIKVYFDKHFVTTPMVSLAARNMGCDLGIVITASHNPPAYNGYKLKSKAGGPLLQKYVEEIEAMIPDSFETEDLSLEEWEEKGLLEFVDLETQYYAHVADSFDLELMNDPPDMEDSKIVAYDAMWGAGQNIFPRIMPNADLLHCDYNPSFYGQAPEPIAKNLIELRNYLREMKHVDIAIATDGDGDRIGIFNGKGKFIDAHHIILLLIHILHKYKDMTGKVVVAFSVSDKVKKLCAAYGLPVQVTKIGFKYICEVIETEDVLVGGEESGGISVKGHIPERDGIWDGLLIVEHLIQYRQTLDELIEEVYEITGPFAYNRDDLYLKEEQKQRIIENCKNGVYKNFGDITVHSVEDIDGYKFHLGEEEIVMIRASGTEPVLRIYAEGATDERVQEILEKTKKALIE